MKAETVFVSRKSASEAGLRFFSPIANVNETPEQVFIHMDWNRIRQMIKELQYLDPEMRGKPRNL